MLSSEFRSHHERMAPTVRGGLVVRALLTSLFLVLLTALATPALAQTVTGTGFLDAIYVPNRDSDTVSVIDLQTNTVVDTIFLGAFSGPTAGIALEDATKLYVTQQYKNSVAVIDTATNTVIKEIPVGWTPLDIAISPDSTTVYVTSFFSDEVHAIDTTLDAVVAVVDVDGDPATMALPLGLEVTPDGSQLWVSCQQPGEAAVIDTATMTRIGSVSLAGGTPVDVAFNDAGDTAWVVSFRQDGLGVLDVVQKIDTATLAILEEHNSGTDANIGRGAAEVIVDDEDTAFVSNMGPIDYNTFRPVAPHPDYITEIDDKGNTSTILTGGLAPVGIITSWEGKDLYVSNAASNDVSILTRGKKDHTILAVVPVGNFPVTPVTFGKPIPTGAPPAAPPTLVPFATYVQTKMVVDRKGKRKFGVHADFTLGAASDGIDPLTEDVFLSFDGLWYNLEAGTMTWAKNKWSWKGQVTGTKLSIDIKDLGNGVFEIVVHAEPTYVPYIDDPTQVLIRIGDDQGVASWSPCNPCG